MIVFLNGQFLPEEQARVSVFDRGFLYGDGLFETLRIFNGLPFRWEQHWERFRLGAEFLGIRLEFSSDALRGVVGQLVAQNQMSDALLRWTVSRGIGPRGYSPEGAEQPTLVMSLHPAPTLVPEVLPQWRLVTASVRLPANEQLAQFKTCNKLPQILARAEAASADADEALLLNTSGQVVEGSSSNLFCLKHDVLSTPPLASGILPGVTRAVVFELCQSLGLSVREAVVTPEELWQARGVFLSVSSVGLAEALSLE